MKSKSSKTTKAGKLGGKVGNQPATTWAASGIIILVTCATFLPVLSNRFVWDDYQNLIDNTAYRGLGWSQLRWMWTTFHMGPYQPLSWMTLGFDYLIWGMNPVGYHLTNVLFHGANAALFYFICRRLLALALPARTYEGPGRLNMSAAFAALLFAIHPLRVESVAWATERRDVLSGFFFLWTLSCYLRATSNPEIPSRRRWLSAAVLVYSLSLLSKATTVMLPVLLIVLDIYPLRRLEGGPLNWFKPQFRKVLWEKSLFLALSSVFAVVALLGQYSAGALKPLQQYDVTSRVGQAFYGIIFYLWKSILPIDLSPLYELPYDREPWIRVFALCAVATVGISLAFYFLRRRWPALLACWICYVAMLAPVLGIAQSGPQLVADRYSYLPCLSWALLVAGGLFFYWLPSSDQNPNRPRALLAHSVIVVGTASMLSFLTWGQTQIWRDPRTLWQYAVAVSPASSIAQYNLGRTLEAEGGADQARELYRRAVILNPRYADAHHNLARLLARSGEQEEAIQHYRRALEIEPDDPDSHNNLGLLLAIRGKFKESLEELQKALEIDPHYARAYFNMTRVFASRGELEKALTNYQEALKLSPNEAEVQFGLGSILAQQGKLEAAAAQFQQAVNLRPDFADAHVALARLLAAQGKKKEAERHYEEALRLIKSQSRTPPS